MGDKGTLMKARQELEDLYLGIPDESVDLTFKDLPSFQQNKVAAGKVSNMQPIHEELNEGVKISKSFGKSPSIDFAKGLQGVLDHRRSAQGELYRKPMAWSSFKRNSKYIRSVEEHSELYNDVSGISMHGHADERGGKRRIGIPHSNICALCSVCIYFFRHRCLVCGRVYCRQCVREGMGEMSEGRKCMDCLGKRFSKRYIQRAGSTGCCWRYPSAVKIQELIWAEKGPRRSNERRYRGDVASRLRSPVMMPGTPTRSRVSRPRSPVMPGTPRSIVGACPGSFAMSPTFSTNVHGFPM